MARDLSHRGYGLHGTQGCSAPGLDIVAFVAASNLSGSDCQGVVADVTELVASQPSARGRHIKPKL